MEYNCHCGHFSGFWAPGTACPVAVAAAAVAAAVAVADVAAVAALGAVAVVAVASAAAEQMPKIARYCLQPSCQITCNKESSFNTSMKT